MNNLSTFQENKIKSVLNIFETGKVETDYDSVFTYNDGRNGRKQITLGIGFTEDGGSLIKLIEVYQLANSTYSSRLYQYIGLMGKGKLANDGAFIAILKYAANDPVFREAQDFIYRALYVFPARKQAEIMGLKLPLSILVVQDSVLHGSMGIVRKLFAEVPPVSGGDEKAWVKAYCTYRREWWRTHKNNPSETTYRMDCFLDAINRGNWDLSLPLNANGTRV